MVNGFVHALINVSTNLLACQRFTRLTVAHTLSTAAARKPQMTILATDDVVLFMCSAKCSGVFTRSNMSWLVLISFSNHIAKNWRKAHSLGFLDSHYVFIKILR